MYTMKIRYLFISFLVCNMGLASATGNQILEEIILYRINNTSNYKPICMRNFFNKLANIHI